MKKKARTMRVTVHDADTTCSWNSSAITFKEFSNGEVVKRLTVLVDRPATLDYIRDQLNKIEAAWRSELKRLEATV